MIIFNLNVKEPKNYPLNDFSCDLIEKLKKSGADYEMLISIGDFLAILSHEYLFRGRLLKKEFSKFLCS